MTNKPMTSPRYRIAMDVIERAKDAKDDFVIAACRRVIVADRRGWRTHGNPSDLDLVYAFYAY